MEKRQYIIGQEVFEKEIMTLQTIKRQLNETFDDMLNEMLNCEGKVVFIGMGKSGHIAKKIAATMASLGTCSISLHPGECMHGDLGMIQKQDVVVMISYSGESEEIIRIIPGINRIGATILGITGNRNSTLAKACKVVQYFDNIQEACHLGLAPTSSTTAVLVYGDALAIAASKGKNFSKDDFGLFHPAGSLGKKLVTRVVDLMHVLKTDVFLYENSTIFEAIQKMIDSTVNLMTIVNEQYQLIGIVTNADLKKKLETSIDIKTETVKGIIHYYPYFVDDESMAVEALEIMEKNHICAIPVVKNNQPIGVIERMDIIKYGIYL